MSSRTLMRQQIERQKVLEEEKSRDINVSKLPSDSYNFSYKNVSNDSLSCYNSYLPNLSQSFSAVNQNFEYSDQYLNNCSNIPYNQDPSLNCVDDYSNEYSSQRRNLDSPYIMPSGYQFNSYSLPQYNAEVFVDNKTNSTKFPFQYEINNTNLQTLNHEINNNEFSLSCPVTGEQSDISITHPLSSCNFAPNQPSSLQNANNTDDRRSKDRNKKESHNRIERKRRDFINQQITELSHMIPPQMMIDGESKKNKGNILKNSVDYISFLQNEMNNINKYIKETELAFALLEFYRKRNQELEYQIKQLTSQSPVSSPSDKQILMNYNTYLILREQNQRFCQTNDKSSASKIAKPNTPDANNRLLTVMNTKPKLSPLENGIAFKIELSSAHSSVGNNSSSVNYRIETEQDVTFSTNNQKAAKSPRNNYQKNMNSQMSLPSLHSETIFSSNSHPRCLDNQKCELMET